MCAVSLAFFCLVDGTFLGAVRAPGEGGAPIGLPALDPSLRASFAKAVIGAGLCEEGALKPRWLERRLTRVQIQPADHHDWDDTTNCCCARPLDRTPCGEAQSTRRCMHRSLNTQTHIHTHVQQNALPTPYPATMSKTTPAFYKDFNKPADCA